MSAHGRYVAFLSQAPNLVPHDTNRTSDVFVRDRRSGTTRRVSVNGHEGQAKGASFPPAISADGRYVAFASLASNLVPGDTNHHGDVFVRDRLDGTTERVSVTSGESQVRFGAYERPAISADGRFVAFTSGAPNFVTRDTNGDYDVFVRDRWKGTTALVSISSDGTQGNGPSGERYGLSISGDGRHVAFGSDTSTLVSGDDDSGANVFIRSPRAHRTSLVSVARDGTVAQSESQFPSVSSRGRFVAFMSGASNLVRGDTNGRVDVFVRDMELGSTHRVSISSGGAELTCASGGSPAISGSGRYVVFVTAASNVVRGDTNGKWDVFVRDRRSGITSRVSVSSTEEQANGLSHRSAAISGDGRYVAFTSYATNLVPGDTNGLGDVFVRDQGSRTTERVSVNSSEAQAIAPRD